MNAIAQSSGRVALSPEERAKKIADSFNRIETGYLAHFRPWQAVGVEVREPGADRTPVVLDLWLSRPDFRYPRTNEYRQEAISKLRAYLDEKPDPSQLSASYSALVELSDKISRPINRTAIALMIEAFPNGRANSPEVWMEAITAAIAAEGFSTLVVAKACNLIMLTKTFPPSVHEVIERCTAVRRHVEEVIAAFERYEVQRKVYFDAISWLETASLWSPDPGSLTPGMTVDLPYDPFAFSYRTKPTGRVGWV